MTLTFRAVDPAAPEFAEWSRTKALVFHVADPQTPEQLDAARARVTGNRLTGAFDGDVVAGTFVSWDTWLTVPGGGTVAADAVSGVTVRPTHRRRGVLTRLMHDDLAAAADRGVPVAILFASEATIYGRFGYAVATRTAVLEVDSRRAAIRPEVPRSGRVDVVGAEAGRAVVEQVFAAARRPGEIDHKPHWWDAAFGLGTDPGPAGPPVLRQVVLHTADDGTPTGYLRYRVEDHWEHRRINTVVIVDELRAATGTAYVELWRYLLDLDLVAVVRAGERPVDEPLAELLTDRRAVRQTELLDFQWHRLLDPAAALSARRYERAGSVVLEVLDTTGGWAAGTFTLEAGPDGTGACTRTPTADPDLTLTVEALSGAWLGGGDLRTAGLAGLATEHTVGALDRLAGLLRTAEPPYTRTIF